MKLDGFVATILPGPEDVVDAALVYDREAAVASKISHIFQGKNINKWHVGN